MALNDCYDFSSQFTYCSECLQKLEDTWDIDATIKRVPKDEGAARTVRDTEFVVNARRSVEEGPIKCRGPWRGILTFMRT